MRCGKMNYEFPTIQHINDVRPLVKGRDDFSISERDEFIYICYNRMTPDTFPAINSEDDKILRECRGITFSAATGRIIARKYHKFFNLGERAETASDAINWSRPHVILEKLDGSMIVPVRQGKYIRWHSKRGISETAMRAESFVARRPNYVDFADNILAAGNTPIFEWCSRKDKIVLDYPEDCLILTAVRDMVRGHYMSYGDMEKISSPYSIPIVQRIDPAQNTTQQIINFIGDEENREGVVIRFDDGHMLKVKSDWYVQLHRVVSNFVREYNVVRVIIDDQMDDLKAVLVQHKHPLAIDLDGYVVEFWSCFNNIVAKSAQEYTRLREEFSGDRKGIATSEFMTKKASPLIKMLVFKHCDGQDPAEVLLNHLRLKVSRQSLWQQIKDQSAFVNLKWKERGE